MVNKKERINQSKTWLVLLVLAFVLFTVVGFMKIVVDKAFLDGTQYLITAVIYGYIGQMIRKNESLQVLPNNRMKLGFIFSVLGLRSLHGYNYLVSLWGLGLILLISGIFIKQKEKDNLT